MLSKYGGSVEMRSARLTPGETASLAVAAPGTQVVGHPATEPATIFTAEPKAPPMSDRGFSSAKSHTIGIACLEKRWPGGARRRTMLQHRRQVEPGRGSLCHHRNQPGAEPAGPALRPNVLKGSGRAAEQTHRAPLGQDCPTVRTFSVSPRLELQCLG